ISRRCASVLGEAAYCSCWGALSSARALLWLAGGDGEAARPQPRKVQSHRDIELAGGGLGCRGVGQQDPRVFLEANGGDREGDARVRKLLGCFFQPSSFY